MQFTDQTGYGFSLPRKAERIVSLVPSQTELLHDLGLNDQVVGITRFCIHPDTWFKNKTRIGGTKDFSLEKIRNLKPDLILAAKEENTASLILELREEFPVWTSDISQLGQALEMITEVGRLTGKEAAAQNIVIKINDAFNSIASGLFKDKKVLYYIWKDPWLVAGQDTFIADMLLRCGFSIYPAGTRYPELPPEQLQGEGVDFILLSSEPFPFRDEHRNQLQHLYPEARVLLVDGEYFSWYGSRLADAPAYFHSLAETGNSLSRN